MKHLSQLPATLKSIAKIIVVSMFSVAAYSQTNTLPPTGNVGIGTTTPSTALQVNGTARIDSSLVVKDSIVIHKTARVKSDLKVDGNTVLKNDATIKNDLKVVGNSTLKGDVVIKEGIFKIKPLGDTSLSESGVLLIKGNGTVENGGELKKLVYQEIEQAPPCLADMNGGMIYTAPYWQAAGMPNPIMYVLNTNCSPDPRVGIGVKPTAKLHVKVEQNSSINPFLIEKKSGSSAYKLLEVTNSGLLYAREIKVNLDSWPDYVFDENYQLMPLEEVHDFIKANNHLPNVPNACEMEAEGINVAKSNAILMEKVEELTLYLIQINEQVQAQQELLKQQQETIRLQQELINEMKKLN